VRPRPTLENSRYLNDARRDAKTPGRVMSGAAQRVVLSRKSQSTMRWFERRTALQPARKSSDRAT
jgi:hypothetical protein